MRTTPEIVLENDSYLFKALEKDLLRQAFPLDGEGFQEWPLETVRSSISSKNGFHASLGFSHLYTSDGNERMKLENAFMSKHGRENWKLPETPQAKEYWKTYGASITNQKARETRRHWSMDFLENGVFDCTCFLFALAKLKRIIEDAKSA